MTTYNLAPEKIPLHHVVFFVDNASLRMHQNFLQQLTEKKLPNTEKTWYFCNNTQNIITYINDGVPDHNGIALVGGEAFITSCLHLLVNTKAPVIVLPLADTDNLNHAWNIPKKIDRALAKIKYQLFHQEDILHFNENQKAIYKMQWGEVPFTKEKHLPSLGKDLPRVFIEHDQGKLAGVFTSIIASHLPLKGAPLHPRQTADDGLFELFLFTKKPCVLGTSPNDYSVETIQTSYAQISFDSAQLTFIDQCSQTHEKHFEIYTKERALWLLDQSTKLNTPSNAHFFI